MDEGPWYKDGLRFTCTQCGDCCSGGPGFVWLNTDEIRQIAEYKGVSLGEMQMHHLRYVGDASPALRRWPNISARISKRGLYVSGSTDPKVLSLPSPTGTMSDMAILEFESGE